MKLDEGQYLAHYGILRRSGRYPWGSGANPHQRSESFLQTIAQHRKSGMSDAEIAKAYSTKEHPFTVADLRALKSRASHLQKQEQIRQVQRLADKGMSNSAIARQMSTPQKKYNESTIRSLREPGRLDRLDTLQKTADMLKKQVEEKGIIDVGAHVERALPIDDHPSSSIGISKDKFNTAISMLKEEGYAVTTLPTPQIGTGETTRRKVLLKPPRPNMSAREIQRHAFLNRDNVQLITAKTNDGGRSYDMEGLAFKKPLSIDHKRIGVRYKEDGGAGADGVIYVRPGVHDVSLGKSQYAQVRVAVGGTHFLKGMAVYHDSLPKGVDLLFNTNKSNTGNKLDAMKELKKGKDGKVDWQNPFGAFPKPGGQIKDEHGNVTSAMNILNEQGDWHKWSNNLSSQFLSKQSPDLAKSQLDLTYERRKEELGKLKALTNPLIKRKLLETFGDETDSAAVRLKAANMPGQATKVILPVGSLKPHEIFAPTYDNGTRVSLVRFPHAGPFEIPELTVNNRNREAKALFGSGGKIQAPDAVGIHPKVAERLSGADFDGDHVVVIPNSRGEVQSRPPLEGLKNFDPHMYQVPLGPANEKFPNGVPTITDSRKQKEMGKVTNLISDMTVKGASDAELAQAVRHSMVVIDSWKHNLDFKASERDNNILALKRKYQGVNPKTGQPRGASTLLTRATSDIRVPKRKDAPAGPGLTRTSRGTIDNATGEKRYVLTGEKDAHGNLRTFRSDKLAETTDARTLLSDHGGTPIEKLYADHSNRLKALANEARKELVRTELKRRSASAAKVYDAEVKSLNAKLNIALKNAPLERRAQTVANAIVAQKRRANSDMEQAELRKIRAQALNEARLRTGAKKHQIEITDREWEAIQHDAISIDKLKNILNNTDIEKLRERATPKISTVMTPVRVSRARAMLSSGATEAEVARALGVSVSTLHSSLNG